MEDIKITEGTILESLNNKADIDGGNYKGSGLQAVLEETTLGTAGGTVTGFLEVISGFHTRCIEFTNANNDNGGYIDFQFNGDKTVDYTSRIIEDSSGRISVVATNGFNFPKCITRATTTSSASASKVAVVVQNYVSGTSWYRVWSDGWIEQGGVAKSNGQNVNTSVSLLKGFANANYNIVVTQKTESTMGSYINSCSACPNTTKDFYIRTGHGEKMDYNWRACGY